MARSRNIKPSFFRNPELADCTPYARLLFIGLWTIADREGRLEDRPRYIKFELMPSDDFDVDTELDALAERGFIIRYTHGASRFIQVVNFGKHQNPHVKEAPSTIPAPDSHSANTVQATLNPDSLLLNPESGILIADCEEPDADAPDEQPEPVKPDVPAKPKAPRKQVETFVPESFPLEDRHYTYAASKGISREQVEAETERFLLWHGAKQTRYADWYKAWQSWMLRTANDAGTIRQFNGNGRPAVELFNGEPVIDRHGNPTPAYFKRQLAENIERGTA